MGRRQRLLFALAAAVVAVLAIVVLSGGSDREQGATNAGPAPPSSATPQTGEELEGRNPTPTATPAPPRIVVRGGAVAGGPERLRFSEGETARFTVASDVADEVHVHGYDIVKEVRAGGTARFAFPADIPGIFEVELEGRHTQIAQLRVDP